MSRAARVICAATLTLILWPCAALAQPEAPFTVEDILSPGYPYELVAAKRADRIAWIAYERGMRNVYTAVAPDFEPIRLTRHLTDDGIDLANLRISDDGSVVVFVRGHAPNSDGWVANPTSAPDGAKRMLWAASTIAGEPWPLVEGANPVLSPDGRWVLLTADGQIYAVPVDRGLERARAAALEKPLFTVYGRNSGPVWSPDGRRVAFVSNRDDHAYIGIYDMLQPGITYMAPGVDRDTSPTWSPDGTRIAFIRRPGYSFGQQVGGGGAGSGGGTAGGAGRATQRRGARSDTLPEPPAGLYQAAFEGGHTLALWVGDPATGVSEEFWHPAPDDTVFTAIRRIEWAGEHVIFQIEQGEWRHLYSLPVSSRASEPEDLTPGEGFTEYSAVAPDGEYLYYATNVDDIDRRHLWRTRTRGGRTRQLTRGEDIETQPAPLGSGRTVAALVARADLPLSVGVVNAGGGRPRIIYPTLPQRFPAALQVQPENVTLRAEDGVEFGNQLFLPRDLRTGERRPALIFIHGGPQRQMLLGYHYRHFYHMAYAMNQYFANKGYVVLSVNYRSGIGYGRTFRNAEERGSRGNSEYRDIMAAGLYLQGRPDVDPERVGLWGLSYGGILTAQGLARNSDIFAAGVDLAGVHLWGSSLDPESVSYQASSISEVEKWTSPVLLIHGDDDRNVDFSQTVGLVQLLRANGVYHELIVFPDDVHDSLLFERWILSFEATDDFFDRFLWMRGGRRP